MTLAALVTVLNGGISNPRNDDELEVTTLSCEGNFCTRKRKSEKTKRFNSFSFFVMVTYRIFRDLYYRRIVFITKDAGVEGRKVEGRVGEKRGREMKEGTVELKHETRNASNDLWRRRITANILENVVTNLEGKYRSSEHAMHFFLSIPRRINTWEDRETGDPLCISLINFSLCFLLD